MLTANLKTAVHKKLKVAVTGNIGSGKSSFCRFLEDQNYSVIKADEVAKEVMLNDKWVKAEIIKNFGSAAYEGNNLNKKYLSEKIFSNQSSLFKINSIVHPVVVEKVFLLMDHELKTSNIVFHEAALIYEAGIAKLFDFVVLITADLNVRLNRVLQNYKWTEEEFTQREQYQIPQEEKAKQADFVFANNGPLTQLKEKSELLLKILNGLITK